MVSLTQWKDWLIVHFGWTDRCLSQPRLRLFFIIVPFVISVGIAVPPLFFGMYNYPRYVFTCYLSDSPYSCGLSDVVDCERGDGAREYIYGCFAFVLFCNMIITVVVSMLVHEIFYQEKKIDRFLTQGQEQRQVMTIKTAWQGLFYVGASTGRIFHTCWAPFTSLKALILQQPFTTWLLFLYHSGDASMHLCTSDRDI